MTKEISNVTTEKLDASRREFRAFGEHYDYDTSYMEALMGALPGAWT